MWSPEKRGRHCEGNYQGDDSVPDGESRQSGAGGAELTSPAQMN